MGGDSIVLGGGAWNIIRRILRITKQARILLKVEEHLLWPLVTAPLGHPAGFPGFDSPPGPLSQAVIP